MKAWRFESYGPPESMSFIEAPKPSPRDDEVLVQVDAAGINRSDVVAVAGAFKSTTPRTPGRDFAGVIASGPDTGLAVWGSGAGFGVSRDGAHAEFFSAPRSWLKPRPSALSPAEAAASGVPFVIAYEGLITAGRLRRGETVLLTGASGAVGRAVKQLAAHVGARVIGLDRAVGSEPDMIDAETTDLPAAVKGLTGGAGVDLVFDAVGGELFEPALRSLKLGGRQVAIASPGKRQVSFDLIDFYHNETTLRGVDSMGFSGERVGGIVERLNELFEMRALRPFELETRPLAEAVSAYTAVRDGSAKRQVLTVGSGQ